MNTDQIFVGKWGGTEKSATRPHDAGSNRVSTIRPGNRNRRSSASGVSTQYLMKEPHLNHLNREPSETCFLLQASVGRSPHKVRTGCGSDRVARHARSFVLQ